MESDSFGTIQFNTKTGMVLYFYYTYEASHSKLYDHDNRDSDNRMIECKLYILLLHFKTRFSPVFLLVIDCSPKDMVLNGGIIREWSLLRL